MFDLPFFFFAAILLNVFKYPFIRLKKHFNEHEKNKGDALQIS
jgi:hypothetical protein